MTGMLYVSKVCQHLAAVSTGGGQNKKARRSRGHCSDVVQHIHGLIHTVPSYASCSTSGVFCDVPSSLLCPLCLHVLV